MVRLPSDVWHLVLPYLKRDPPPPRSNPPRSALRQDDLCAAARVNHMFLEIVEPLLYKHIITDFLPNVLLHHKRPAMRRRLAMTQKLQIEYYEKGRDVRYPTLMYQGGGAWRELGRMGDELEKAIMEDAGTEVFAYSEMLAGAILPPGWITFPRVESVSIAAYYGQPDDLWSRFDLQPKDKTELFSNTSQFFDIFLARLPMIKHICTRNTDGPLLCGYVPNPAHPIPPCERTVHFGRNVNRIYLKPSVPMKMVSDAGPEEDWTYLLEWITQSMMGLAEKFGKRPGPEIIKQDIYCSTPRRTLLTDEGDFRTDDEAWYDVSEADQRKTAKEHGEEVQEFFREVSGPRDEIRWFPSQDSPVCGSCGAGAPF